MAKLPFDINLQPIDRTRFETRLGHIVNQPAPKVLGQTVPVCESPSAPAFGRGPTNEEKAARQRRKLTALKVMYGGKP